MRKATVWSLIGIFGISYLFVMPEANAGRRVEEINSRLENQSGRVPGKGKHKMTTGEQIRADEADYRIANQEQRMRTRHHGKLTKHDQRVLNRELNRNSRRIHADKQ
jgi:hypothetical protein